MSNNPLDGGGLTQFGISKAAYPQVDVANLTEAEAVDIYRRDYWQFDGVADQRMANLLFSMAVNNGKRSAISNLQKVLGLVQDGVWGNITERVLNGTPGAITLYANRMILRYVGIAANDRQGAFLNGWVHRVLEAME